MNNMSNIPMIILEYKFNDQGVTEQIIIAFQHYQGNEQFNARVSLDQEYVFSINENLVLDSMNKEQIENFARRKLREWIMTPRPEPTEEDDTEEEAPAEEEATE